MKIALVVLALSICSVALWLPRLAVCEAAVDHTARAGRTGPIHYSGMAVLRPATVGRVTLGVLS